MNPVQGGRAAARWAEWMVRWRWAVLLLTLIAVAVLGSGVRFLSFTNDYRVFFSKENPSLTAFENLQDTYTRNDNVLIMLLPRSGTVFDRHVLQAVRELTEKAWQVPYSSRVDSLTNFQHTWADGDDLMVEDLVDDPAALSDADLERIRDIA
ncbi:MAG TPA: RND transporter, partial [Chromatiales bacterium]|nr:RND transporter [Chromatiales bacterium]